MTGLSNRRLDTLQSTRLFWNQFKKLFNVSRGTKYSSETLCLTLKLFLNEYRLFFILLTDCE